MLKKENNLMMLLIIGSEAIFFLSLIMGYVYFWQSGHYAAAVKATLDIKSTAVFTALLISSSLTFWLVEHFNNKGEARKVKVWLVITILLGLLFLMGQGHEWYRLLQKQFTVSSSLFGTTFYTLTGFHGLHVLLGLIMLIILFILALHGFFERKSTVLRAIGLYWHFVDVVWIAVFTIVYVIPYLT